MNIFFDLLLCFLLATIPAAFNYFLDYALGHPMSDKVNTKAIFFRYSLLLAKRALPEKQQRQLVSDFSAMLNHEDPEIRRQGKQQLNLSIMMSAREFFFYEQALGMCPFCTNFWVCMIVSIVYCATIPLAFIHPVCFFLLTPIYSHTILRKF